MVNLKDLFFPVEMVPHQIVGFEHYVGDSGVSIIRPDKELIISNASTRYQLVRHEDVYKAVIEGLSKSQVVGDKYSVVFAQPWGSKMCNMRIRIKLQQEIMLEEDPSRLFACIDIINSYDRSASYKFEYGIYREVCTNGLIIPLKATTVFSSRKHIDANINLSILPEKVDEAVSFLLQTAPHLLTKAMRGSTSSVIPYEKVVKFGILSETELNDYLMLDLEENYYHDMGKNRYAQIQAMSEFAQSLSNNRRFEIEIELGKIL